MKRFLLCFIIALGAWTAHAQCPNPTITTLSGEPTCTIVYYKFKTESGNTGYQWTVTNGALLYSTGVYDTVTAVFAAGSGSISVNYNKSGCSTLTPAVKNVTITTSPTGTITVSPSSPGYCSGDIVTYTAPTGSNISGYKWSILPPSLNPSLASGILVSGSSTSSQIQVQWTANSSIMTGAIRLQYNDSNQPGCPVITNQSIPIGRKYTTTVAGPTQLCKSVMGTFSIPDLAGDTQAYNVMWTISGSEGTVTVPSTNVAARTLDYYWTTPGTKTVSVNYQRNGSICPVQIGTPRTVVIPDVAPISIVTAPPNPVCVNTSVDYVATAGFTSYYWQTSSSDVEIDPLYGNTSQTFRLKWTNNKPTPINVWVIAWDATNCTTVSSQFAVTTKGPGVTIAAGSPLCISGSTVFNVSGTITGTPTWTLTGGGTITSSSSTSATVSWTNTAGTRTLTYSANGTTPDGCTITTATPIKSVVTLYAPPSAPSFSPTPANNSLCTDGLMQFVPPMPPSGPPGPNYNPPYSYVWSVTAPDVFTGTNTQQTTTYPYQVKWGNTAGTRPVSLKITDGNGCSTTTTNNYTVVTAPTLTLSGVNALCPGQTATITVSGGTAPYTWTYNGTTLPSIGNSVTNGAGGYTVTKVIPNGCTVGASYVVSPVTVPTIASWGSSTTVCDGTYLQLFVQGTPAGNPYQWKLNGVDIPGATASSYNATAAGTYTVSTVSPAVCPSQPFTITKTYAPAVTMVASKLVSCGGSDVNLSLSNYVAGHSYTVERMTVSDWQPIYPGNIASAPIAVGVGVYRLRISPIGTNCYFYGSNISINSVATQVPTNTPDGTFGICRNGTFSITASAGFSSYQWQKDNVDIPGATSSTYVAMSTGQYKVKTVDGNGCPYTKTAVLLNSILEPPTVAITNTGPTTVCSDSYVPFTATAGLTYKWYKDNVEIPGATSQTYNGQQTGTYAVLGTNANGCSSLSNGIAITVNQIPTVLIDHPAVVNNCGSPVILGVGAGSSALTAYQWKRETTVVGTTVTVSADQTGTYTLKGTDSNGCSNTSTPISVNINPVPVIIISPSGPLDFCPGSSVTLTASGGSVPYQWKRNSVLMSETAASITVSDAAVYTATWTNSYSCPGSASVVTTVKALPSNTVSIVNNTPTTFCDGGNVKLRADDGDSWQWRKDGSNITGATLQEYTATQSGAYTCIIGKSGCTVTSASTNVNVLALPTPTITNLTPLATCGPTGVTLRAGGGSSYQWRLNGIPVGAVVTATDQTFYTAGDYSVDVFGANGCMKTSSLVTYTVNTIPAKPVISSSGATTFCEGGSVILSTTYYPQWSYEWYRNGVQITNNYDNYTISTLAQAGTYKVVMISPQGCRSSESDPKTVTVNPKPTASITPAANVTFCGTTTLTATPVSGATYQWYRNGTLTLGTAQTQSISMGGIYTVKVTNPTTSCSATSQGTNATLSTVPATPTINVTQSCSGGSATLTSSIAAPIYTWSNGSSGPGYNSINVTTGGTYTLQLSTGNPGCISGQASISISMAAPNFNLTQTGNLCTDGQVTLNVGSVVGTIQSIQWSPASGSSQSITVYSQGTYTCKITFVGGCQITKSIVVQRIPANCQINLVAQPVVEIPAQNLDEVITETSFYPNPADREINFTMPTSPVARKISLINMQGVEVQTSIIPAGTTKTTLPLGSLSDGMYIIQIQSNGKFERLKMIVNQKR